MDDKQKKQLLKKLKKTETGDIAKNDDDLVKSEGYLNKPQAEKARYKEFYDDVKLSIKEDW